MNRCAISDLKVSHWFCFLAFAAEKMMRINIVITGYECEFNQLLLQVNRLGLCMCVFFLIHNAFYIQNISDVCFDFFI